MEYQVGQAVVSDGGLLLFVKSIYKNSVTLVDILGEVEETISKLDFENCFHCATEAEILAEAVKGGWYFDYLNHLNSPKGHCILCKAGYWCLANLGMIKPTTETLKEYCEEGLIAHRLITALNLVK